MSEQFSLSTPQKYTAESQTRLSRLPRSVEFRSIIFPRICSFSHLLSTTANPLFLEIAEFTEMYRERDIRATCLAWKRYYKGSTLTCWALGGLYLCSL